MATSPFVALVPSRTYLREWREFRGLSQEELGKRVGATGATISRYEKGDRGLPHELSLKLFAALDILPGQFYAPPETPDLNAFAVGLSEQRLRELLKLVEEFVKHAPKEA